MNSFRNYNYQLVDIINTNNKIKKLRYVQVFNDT
jgi:hypothetical protein